MSISAHDKTATGLPLSAVATGCCFEGQQCNSAGSDTCDLLMKRLMDELAMCLGCDVDNVELDSEPPPNPVYLTADDCRNEMPMRMFSPSCAPPTLWKLKVSIRLCSGRTLVTLQTGKTYCEAYLAAKKKLERHLPPPNVDPVACIKVEVLEKPCPPPPQKKRWCRLFFRR